MEIKVKANQPQNQTNPPKTNSNPQLQPQSPQPLQQIVEEVLKKYLQNLSPQPQQNSLSDGEFIVKSGMKSSYVAVKVEQILLAKKKIVLSGLGFAIPILIDAVLLVRKDMGKVGKQVNIEGIELVEKELLTSNMKKKIVSGIKVTLTI
jgi:DNA-binding protein